MKNIKFISLMSLFRDGVRGEAMVSLRNFIELPVLVSKIGGRIVFTIFSSRGKVSSRLRQMHNFYHYVLLLRTRHGDAYCVNYLKACQLAIQKAIGGDKISSLREINPSYSFPRLTASGLPRYIPLSDRRAIMNRSTNVIRWGLTLYSIYRIVDIPGTLKLQSITDPFSGDSSFLELVSSDLKLLSLRSKRAFDLRVVQKERGIQLFESASPTSSTSGVAMFVDPFRLAKAGLGQVMLDYMQEMGYSGLLSTGVRIFGYFKIVEKCFNNEFYKRNMCPGVGQLSRKVEAAGKVRVFAMVDVWTQSLLFPLHQMIFTFLKSLPNDGTFDQTSACTRAGQKAMISGCSFGYDLSAATDRLPVSLQVAILSPLIGDKAANLGRDMLVGRDYGLSNSVKDQTQFSCKPWEPLRYSVGQPMGALSSGAMLALTHHLLVQLAYSRAYQLTNHLVIDGSGFTNYELLGDDIVIFDPLVAQQYLQIMEGIGVPINVSKSVVATNPTVEFAKVTMHYGVNVSALSGKMFISQNTLMGRVNIVYSLINKGYAPSVGVINGINDIIRPSKVRRSNIILGLLPLLAMYNNSGKISTFDVLAAIDTEGGVTSKALIKGANVPYLSNLISLLIKGRPLRLKVSSGGSPTGFLEWLKRSIRNISADPFNDSKDLALKIIERFFPFKEGDQFDSQYNAMTVAFYNILRDELFSKMSFLENPLYLKDIDEGLQIAEDFDRYSELCSLLSRAESKLEKSSPPKVQKLSLKLLKVLLGVKRFRLKHEELNTRNIYLEKKRFSEDLQKGPRNFFIDR